MDKPTVGRIVWFGFGGNDSAVVARPAIITHVWPDSEFDAVNLVVFCDGKNDETPDDGDVYQNNAVWQTSVTRARSGELERGCWTWPPRPAAPRNDAAARAELLANARALIDEGGATHEGERLREALRYVLRALA